MSIGKASTAISGEEKLFGRALLGTAETPSRFKAEAASIAIPTFYCLEPDLQSGFPLGDQEGYYVRSSRSSCSVEKRFLGAWRDAYCNSFGCTQCARSERTKHGEQSPSQVQEKHRFWFFHFSIQSSDFTLFYTSRCPFEAFLRYDMSRGLRCTLIGIHAS